MKTAHRLNPRNDKEIKMIKALEVATVILEKELGVEVTLQAQRQVGWAGNDAYHAGMYCDSDKLVKINFRNLEGATSFQVLNVLGHEMRHAVQYQQDYLSNRRYPRWQGPTHALVGIEHNDTRFRAYYNRPEEIDARAFQNTYAQFVINHPDFAEYKDALDIEGDVPLKRDYEATYKAMGYSYPCKDIQLLGFRNEHDGKDFWMHKDQVPGCKKWTNKWVQKAFKEYRDVILAQEVKWVMVPITLDDLVS